MKKEKTKEELVIEKVNKEFNENRKKFILNIQSKLTKEEISELHNFFMVRDEVKFTDGVFTKIPAFKLKTETKVVGNEATEIYAMKEFAKESTRAYVDEIFSELSSEVVKVEKKDDKDKKSPDFK